MHRRAVLATLTYDLEGVVELDLADDTDIGETRRRVNRQATLDGGSVVNDAGHTEADRTIELRWTPTAASVEANVDRLVRTYGELICSHRGGVHLCVPEAYQHTPDSSRLRLLVKRQLSG
jgi:hypothetical protein